MANPAFTSTPGAAGNADACNNLGVLHMREGDAEGAVPMFERALKSSPHDRRIRENCTPAIFMLGQTLILRKEHARSIQSFRHVLALDPDNIGARLNLTNALARTGTKAELGDFMADPDVALGNHALIACMPKSGSSLLLEALCRLIPRSTAGRHTPTFRSFRVSVSARSCWCAISPISS